MRIQAIAASVVMTILLLASATVVEAAPPLPSSFHGIVKWDNGNNVPEGTIVSAWINGVKYAETESQMDSGDSVYAIDVPGDDLETPGVEGGVEGDSIVFKVGDSTASQTGTWHTGTDVELNLTAPPTAVTLSSFTARSGAALPTELISHSLLALAAAVGLIALIGASDLLVKGAKDEKR